MSTLALPALPIPSTGSLESYIQSVNRFALLTQEQETDYARRFRDHEDLDAEIGRAHV